MENKRLILLYHRIAEPVHDPYLLCVSPAHFEQHLRVLRARLPVLSLKALTGELVGDPAVAVTFDDGYADNLHNALPLLESYAIPATVFVTADYVDRDKEFWWDEVERLVEVPSDWNVLQPTVPGSAERLCLSLGRILRALPAGVRERMLEELRVWRGNGPCSSDERRPLSRDGLLRLARGAGVEIGAHTLSHGQLSALSIDEQAHEMGEAKRRLEAWLGLEVTSFAYPFGDRIDYSAETAALARTLGFHRACANFAGRVDQSSDPYELPRVMVMDWDGETFARRLEEWLVA